MVSLKVVHVCFFVNSFGAGQLICEPCEPIEKIKFYEITDT